MKGKKKVSEIKEGRWGGWGQDMIPQKMELWWVLSERDDIKPLLWQKGLKRVKKEKRICSGEEVIVGRQIQMQIQETSPTKDFTLEKRRAQACRRPRNFTHYCSKKVVLVGSIHRRIWHSICFFISSFFSLFLLRNENLCASLLPLPRKHDILTSIYLCDILFC